MQNLASLGFAPFASQQSPLPFTHPINLDNFWKIYWQHFDLSHRFEKCFPFQNNDASFVEYFFDFL